MDDEREVGQPEGETTDLVERSKMVFLREIINEFKRRQQQYDLGTEFSKTRQNRSFMVPLVVIALIAVFGVVVVGVTRYIQTQSRSIQVDIDDFADVNLRDVLDEAQRLQNQLDAAERELAQLRSELVDRIEQTERERDRNIELLNEASLTAGQRNARAQEFRAQAQSEIDSLNAEYQPRIAELQARIEQLRTQIAAYDTRQLEQAREQEQILNNQQRVHELEMERLRSEYDARIARLSENYESEIERLESFQQEFERTIRQRHANELAALTLRYNPQLLSEPIGSLLDDPESAAARAFEGPVPWSATLGEEDVLSLSEYRRLTSQYEELTRLVDRLQEVPYRNGVDTALLQIEWRARDLVAQYESVWQQLEQSVIARDDIIADRDATIADLDEDIAQFLFALDELSRINGDPAYIIDPRDPEDIVVYVNSIRTAGAGTLGYVFREDDEFVGTIRFVRRGSRLVAELLEIAEDMELRAFDKVLIEVE